MKKSLVVAHCVTPCLAFIASMVIPASVIAGKEKEVHEFQQQCREVLEVVSTEMGDNTELSNRISEVYSWALDGTDKKQYAKKRTAFIKECENKWEKELSPAPYEKLKRLNARGKKHTGMAGWKKALIATGSLAGIVAIWPLWAGMVRKQ